MSLIFVKSEDNASGESDLNKPYNFTNFFTNPIKLKPDSQIAYINSSFDLTNTGTIDTTEFYYENGFDTLNPVLPLSFVNKNVIDWNDELDKISAQMNNQEVDGDYTPINSYNQIVSGDTRLNYETGFNWFYIKSNGTDGNVGINREIRGINNVFNQGYNCLGTNASWTIISPAGAYTAPAGINTGTGRNTTQFTQGGLIPARATSGTLRYTFPTSLHKMNLFNNPTLPYAPPSNFGDFYSVSYAYNEMAFPVPYNPNTESALIPVYDRLPFNANNWNLFVSATGIKKYVGMSDNGSNKTDAPSIPTQTGGSISGHISISESNLSSGGYVNFTFNTQLITNASNHYDSAFLGNDDDGNPKVVGFCGMYPSFTGVQSLNYIRSLGNSLSDGIQAFVDNVDLNKSDYNNVAEGATARYLFGMKIYEEHTGGNGSVYIQAQVLDPTADITKSAYVDLGERLDLYQLAKGIAKDYRDGDTNQFKNFGTNESYYLNVENQTNLTNPAKVFFRFRWTSPYTMAVEYSIKEYVNVDSGSGGRVAQQGYSEETNDPYESYEYTDANLGSFNGDPRNKWITIADMKIPVGSEEGDTNYKQYFIPSYFGDMAVVHSTSLGSFFTNGYYDIRTQNRDNDLFTNKYFTNTPYKLQTLVKDGNDNANSSEKLKPFSIEDIRTETIFNFDEKGNSGAGKVCKFLLNQILNQVLQNQFIDINGNRMFNRFQPRDLRVGLQLGFTEDLQVSVVELEENPGNDRIYVDTAQNDIQLGDDAFTQHFQIKNLPVQSQNGVISSQNKTIYVVNSLSLNQHIDTDSSKIYSHQAPVLLWVDINNKEDIMLSNMNVLITDDNNKEQKLLVGKTDVVFMVRERPKMITM